MVENKTIKIAVLGRIPIMNKDSKKYSSFNHLK